MFSQLFIHITWKEFMTELFLFLNQFGDISRPGECNNCLERDGLFVRHQNLFSVFTHVACVYVNLLEQKKAFTKEKSSTSTGLVWDTNMAAMTSSEKTILCVQYLCDWSWSVLNVDVARKGRPQSDCSFDWAFPTSINHNFVYLLTDDFVCRFGGGPTATTLSMCAHCKV